MFGETWVEQCSKSFWLAFWHRLDPVGIADWNLKQLVSGYSRPTPKPVEPMGWGSNLWCNLHGRHRQTVQLCYATYGLIVKLALEPGTDGIWGMGSKAHLNPHHPALKTCVWRTVVHSLVTWDHQPNKLQEVGRPRPTCLLQVILMGVNVHSPCIVGRSAFYPPFLTCQLEGKQQFIPANPLHGGLAVTNGLHPPQKYMHSVKTQFSRGTVCGSNCNIGPIHLRGL